jgi:anti-sigma B factor antagonist
MSVQISVEEVSARAAVVTFQGALSFGMSLSLADSQLRGLVDRGFNRLLLDLTNVPYCDSAGLGAIVYAYGLTKQQGGMLRLCGLSDRVAGMLKMTTTDSFLLIDADRPAGIAGLGAEAKSQGGAA